jgi:uncharacterized protein
MPKKLTANKKSALKKNSLPITPKGSIKKYVLLGGLSFLVFVCLGFFLYRNESKPVQEIKNTIKKVVAQPTVVPEPTPYPFYDLTIPYFREQNFDSSLASLEEVASNASYTSYVTNYTSSGFKVNGLLTEPTGERPEGGWPAIVFIHGYLPPSSYATLGQPYSAYVDYLARNGFVVFKIDLRGHGESEGEPGGAYYSSDYVVDSLNAYSALQKAEFVNPNKVGIWGHSMAGNISMRTIAARPEIPAVVIWAGAGFTYTDLFTYRITDASFDPNQSASSRTRMREQIRKLYGDPDPSKPFWQQLAPTNYLSELQGSIQIHHAVDDNVVDIRYSRDLSALLEKASVEHEFYEYQSGGHNISDASFTTAMERTVEFYKNNL